nr:copia protein [Tanacetum cinerariifolium]
MEKDSKIYRGKKERIKSIALKAKKDSSDDETSTSESDDEEYTMVVRNYKKFFRRKGKFVGKQREEKKSFRQRDEKKRKSDRKCFRCGDPNHLIGDFLKLYRNKYQKALIGGLGFDCSKASTSGTKNMSCVGSSAKKAMGGSTIKVHGSTVPRSVCLRTCLEPDEWIKDSGCSKHMIDNKSLFSTYKAYDEGNVVFGSNLKGKIIGKEVYVAQPPGFIDFQKLNYVYKLKKALYGLKQAPKAWYDRLKEFLIKHEYSMGMVDNTLFTKKSKSHLIIVQIYVDDIIFGSTSQNLCDDFAKIMHDEFEMSMMGELNFFLGLQIEQMEDKIFFNQSKYIKEMLKKFGLEDSKPTKSLMSTEIKLTKDDEADSVDSSKYREKTDIAIFTTEAEYVSAGKACQQALWMKQALIDYGIRLDDVSIIKH